MEGVLEWGGESLRATLAMGRVGIIGDVIEILRFRLVTDFKSGTREILALNQNREHFISLIAIVPTIP